MAFYAVGGYGGFGNAYVNRKDKRPKAQRVDSIGAFKPASAMQGMKGAAYGGYGGLGNAPKMGGTTGLGPMPIGPMPSPSRQHDMGTVPSRPSLPAGTARDRDAYAPARPSPADRERERLERKEMKQERINHLMSLLAKEKYLKEQMAGTRLRSQEWHRLSKEMVELQNVLRRIRWTPMGTGFIDFDRERETKPPEPRPEPRPWPDVPVF